MEGSLRQISLSDLGDTIGTPPSPALIGSVRRVGVLQPVVVAEAPDHEGVIGLRVVDGNRRIAAARRSQIDHLPAIVFTDVDQAELSTITLVLNGFRTSNYLTEYWAIKQLERLGIGEADIFSITGLTRSKVQQRTNLSDLNRDLFVALRNGKIYQTHAAAISKMPPENQSAIADIYHRRGRIIQSDLASYMPKKPTRNSPPVHSDPPPSIAWNADVSEYHGNPVSPFGDDTFAPSNSTSNNCDSSNLHVSLSVPEPAEVLAAPLVIGTRSEKQIVQNETFKEPANTPGAQASIADPLPVGDVFATRGTTFSNRLQALMRNTVVAARDMDYSKSEFLELAARKWDEANG